MPMSWIAWSLSILLGADLETRTYIKEAVGSQLVAIHGASHTTNLDNPVQVREEIDNFLREWESG